MIYDKLKEYAGLSKEEADSYFAISETDTEWILKPTRYLEPGTFQAVLDLVRDYGGGYIDTPTN